MGGVSTGRCWRAPQGCPAHEDMPPLEGSDGPFLLKSAKKSGCGRGGYGLARPARCHPDVPNDRDPEEVDLAYLLHGGCEVMGHGAGA